MPKVIRKNTDLSAGHGCFPPTVPNQGSNNVFVNNLSIVRITDDYITHSCSGTDHISGPGREASQGSPNVFANNLKVHRNGDAISCGDTAANGSPNVFANS